ncbi:type IV pilus assembly protein PilM [Candidatus Daviesbacteria bacterium]|nr:type IV pilus assembly protein PilM [Candidatus Daviesbacteria bacterium]
MAAQYRIGLDIGQSSIKLVVLSHKEKEAKLVSLGHIASPQPGIISDADLDLEVVANSIKHLINEVNPPTKDVVVALPESRIFTRVIYDLPYLTNEELAQAIRYASEEFVPMPIADVNLNYQIIFRSSEKGPKSRTVVFVVASPKNIVEKYLKVLNMAALKPVAVETELIAASRALLGINPYSPTTLLIQLSATTSDFAVVSEGVILMTRSIATGGMALTRAIAQAFNFELIQAEEYKKVYGLLEDQLEGKVFQVLKPIADIILSEVKRVIQAHEMQNPQRPIKRVVLGGGGALLPGVVIYFANVLGLEVQQADPWYYINKDANLKTKLAVDAPAYTVAVGLALREN